jgi:hypothetical protein
MGYGESCTSAWSSILLLRITVGANHATSPLLFGSPYFEVLKFKINQKLDPTKNEKSVHFFLAKRWRQVPVTE